MRFLFIILLFPFITRAQTFFGVASTPADNGTNTATTTAVTPPSSMQSGDLVFLYSYQRGASTTMSMSAAGGQTWNTWRTHQAATAVLTGAGFWCRFNGTWATDPSVLFSAGTNTNVVMLVFRPNTSTNIWAEENNGNLSSYNAAASFTITPAYTTTNARTVTIGIWSTDDDNTWGTLTGSGWANTSLSAQYRNTSGSDVSSSYAYNIKTTTGSIASVSLTQATLGNDPGICGWVTFYETTPPVLNRRVTIIQ